MLQWQLYLSNYIVPVLRIALYKIRLCHTKKKKNCQRIQTTNSDYKSREMWEEN